jgi:putative oxidoreductase
MFEVQAAARTPDRMDVLRRWLPRIAMSMFFLNVGTEKFSGTQWVGIFNQIGVGDWLRYVTGWLQIGGAVVLLIRRTVFIGIVMLAVTMVGAALAWIFVLGSPGSAIFPGILLALLSVIAFDARRDTR